MDAWFLRSERLQSIRFSSCKVRPFLAVPSPAGSYIRSTSSVFLRPSGNEVDEPRGWFKFETRTRRRGEAENGGSVNTESQVKVSMDAEKYFYFSKARNDCNSSAGNQLVELSNHRVIHTLSLFIDFSFTITMCC